MKSKEILGLMKENMKFEKERKHKAKKRYDWRVEYQL